MIVAPEFTLQPVLEYRHRRVEALEIELGRMLREQKRAEDRLQALTTRQYELLEEMRALQEGSLDMKRIHQIYNGLRNLQRLINEQKQVLADIQARIDQQRSKVVRAKQDEETLEILKEKEEDRFLEEEKRKEEAARDDIYIAQAFHKNRNLEKQS